MPYRAILSSVSNGDRSGRKKESACLMFDRIRSIYKIYLEGVHFTQCLWN